MSERMEPANMNTTARPMNKYIMPLVVNDWSPQLKWAVGEYYVKLKYRGDLCKFFYPHRFEIKLFQYRSSIVI